MNPVVVIGAGPYGLSSAAHLRARGVPVRVFGDTFGTWRANMPMGMILKSSPDASAISSPEPGHSLRDFWASQGRTELDDDRQVVPIEDFVRYGSWYEERLVPAVEPTGVVSVHRADGDFRVTLASGERVPARAVVVATGLPAFAYVPDELRVAPPRELSAAGPVSHSSQHKDFDSFRGRDVVVVGGGQSALESAALLHEAGASVRVVARRPSVHFGAPPASGPIWQPSSPLGRKWSLYVLSQHAGVVRHLPPRTRLYLVGRVLGPSGAWWLKDRVEGRVPVFTGSRLESLRLVGGRPVLRLAVGGRIQELAADHVLAATGYRMDLGRLDILGSDVRGALARTAGSPRLGRGLESSVPGLYFTGLAAAATFGPVMRFVCGTQFAAPRIAAAVARNM